MVNPSIVIKTWNTLTECKFKSNKCNLDCHMVLFRVPRMQTRSDETIFQHFPKTSVTFTRVNQSLWKITTSKKLTQRQKITRKQTMCDNGEHKQCDNNENFAGGCHVGRSEVVAGKKSKNDNCDDDIYLSSARRKPHTAYGLCFNSLSNSN